jgi:hypothetical protein
MLSQDLPIFHLDIGQAKRREIQSSWQIEVSSRGYVLPAFYWAIFLEVWLCLFCPARARVKAIDPFPALLSSFSAGALKQTPRCQGLFLEDVNPKKGIFVFFLLSFLIDRNAVGCFDKLLQWVIGAGN